MRAFLRLNSFTFNFYMASCFCCVSQHPAPNTQLQTPGAQHPALGIQHPLPNAPHPAPSMRRTLHSTPGPNAQQLAPSVQHPTPSAPHPAKTSEIRFHLVLMNFPNGETVLFLLNFTRPDAKLFPATLQRCVENEKMVSNPSLRIHGGYGTLSNQLLTMCSRCGGS